eukprot:GEZU01011581.1.p1 GENE.GEZU01011581.1~~GEZU01011581.1.p1  ORF type:complete len:112 (+),score=20.53 GEZU01011581.1:51-386(+)
MSEGQGTKPQLITFDPDQMVKIRTKDGFEFIIDKRCAMISKTIKSSLTGDFREKKEATIDFSDFDASIMEKVIQYFYYKQRYDHSPEDRPEFEIEPQIALELMMAAHYLDT